ncbi:hypothetical protein U8V72_15250 [Priestia filamentosa]|uniref:hypothetical protein n=1 Tax=Priestia filamentosa TaxID=1402861 RepID=UPI003979BD1F
MKLLKEKGPYKFMEYDGGNYALDYSNENVGYTIDFSDNKSDIENQFNKATKNLIPQD